MLLLLFTALLSRGGSMTLAVSGPSMTLSVGIS